MFEGADTALREGETAAQAPAPKAAGDAGFAETFGALYEQGRLTADWYGRGKAIEQAYDNRIKAVKEATGVALDNPERMLWPWRQGEREAFRVKLDALSAERPEHRDIIKADRPIEEDAAQLVMGANRRAADLSTRYGNFADLPIIGPLSLPGITAGAIPKSPLQVAGLVFTPLKPVAAGLQGVAVGGARMGLSNAAVSAAGQPWQQAWLKEAGAEYGWGVAAHEVTGAFLSGFLMDAGVRATWRGGRAVLGYEPNLDAKGNVIGYRAKGTPAPELPAAKPDPAAPITQQSLEEAAARLPPDNPMRKAHDGDIAAQREVADALGHGDDPTVKGIIDRNAIERHASDPRDPLLDDGEGLSRLVDAMRRDALPDAELPVGRSEPVLPARHASLADHEAPPPAAFHVDGKPVAFGQVKASALTTDPEAFQFKGGGDARGVTERMRGVEKWDAVAAGRAVIYERADGVQVVADGHQRTGLARRLEDKGHAPISVDAIIFRERDGWTPADVRALAAKKNLQEGTGTAIDAAKVIRERPEIIDSSVPLSSEAMRQARSMAKLSDEAFSAVVAGRLPANMASLIGDLVPEKSRHLGLLNEMAAAEPANLQQARLYLNELLSVPMHVEQQLDLLGAFRVERSLMRERVKVLDKALQLLRQDARVFALLEREAGRIEAAGNKLKNEANAERALQAEAVGEVIEQLASTMGPVSDWLNEAARTVARGEARPGRAAEAFARRVHETLDRDGIKGLQAETPTVRAGGGIDEPGGAAAKAQTEALERELASAIKEAMDEITAFHGSPHDFERFSLEHMGSGEGAQSFGWGLYFAENKAVSGRYRLTTSDAHLIRAAKDAYDEGFSPREAMGAMMEDATLTASQKRFLEALQKDDWLGFDYPHQAIRAALRDAKNMDMSAETKSAIEGLGNHYQVTIKANRSRFIDWDKKLSQQSQEVRTIVERFMGEAFPESLTDAAEGMRVTTGQEFMEALARSRGGKEQAAVALREAGMSGVRYLDGNSRVNGGGTHNLVVFDDTSVFITHKNGEPLSSFSRDLFDVDRVQHQADLLEVCRG